MGSYSRKRAEPIRGVDLDLSGGAELGEAGAFAGHGPLVIAEAVPDLAVELLGHGLDRLGVAVTRDGHDLGRECLGGRGELLGLAGSTQQRAVLGDDQARCRRQRPGPSCRCS